MGDEALARWYFELDGGNPAAIEQFEQAIGVEW